MNQNLDERPSGNQRSTRETHCLSFSSKRGGGVAVQILKKTHVQEYLCTLQELFQTTLLRSNLPSLPFTATPLSVTIAVISSAGVTSKLGL